MLGEKQETFGDSRVWDEFTVRRACREGKRFGAVAKGCGGVVW